MLTEDMPQELSKIISTGEGSGMTSVWNDYLWLTRSGNGTATLTATLEVCLYEALAEIPPDEDWDEILPEDIEGKKVVGVEDDFIVGGELECWDDRTITYSKADLEAAIQLIDAEHSR